MHRIVLFIAVLILPMSAMSTTYYVCDDATDCNAGDGSGWSTGNDTNAGTSKGSPFSTVERCTQVVSAGDTCIVGDGTYSEYGTSDYVFRVDDLDGSAGNYITFQAENRWGAVLDGNFTSYWIIRLDNVSYMRISGFVVREAGDTGIEFTDAQYITIDNNYIFDNGSAVCTDGGGHSGMRSDKETIHAVIEQNVFEDNGRDNSSCDQNDSGEANGFRHDHGYYAQGFDLLIQNNLFLANDAGWPLKVDGNCARDYPEYDEDDYSHIIVNNTFGERTNPDTDSGGVIRFFSNANNCASDGLLRDVSHPLIQNNIFYKPDTFSQASTAAAIRITDEEASNYPESIIYNNLTDFSDLYYDDAAITANITASGNITSDDPELTDPDNGDYTLQSTSPAIDAGLLANAPSDDYLGISRPQGSAIDIGAYEVNETIQDCNLQWASSSEATQYNVYHGATQAGVSLAGTTTSTSTTCSAIDVVPENGDWFAVDAQNSQGNSTKRYAQWRKPFIILDVTYP